MSVRIGCVQYLNAQPLIHGWPGPVLFDHPAALARQLAGHELDVALVSSFEFLRHPIYRIADDLAVATHGAVYSVFVAHKGSIEDVSGITLDPASATSVNLLRCLLAERGLNPKLHTESADARLLIGDQAIAFRAQYENEFNYWDLGAEWKRATGLPFVFALWLIRPEVREPGAIAQQLRARRDANLNALEEVIAAQKNFAPEFCAFYFRECLRFDFGEAEKAGLLRFRSLCEKHRILPPNDAPLGVI
ncbi:MAG TPA: menaquinone biosynthesis protein [Chthoniobacterales bacterium]|nr:menaquinone biosynthesis protein [Chthoniobacterales bacterium]